MIRVSVIIPNYNHAQYLEQRIESVLNQTYQNFEIIILDDCSTDESKKVIEKYRQHNKVTQIVYNETNSGTTFKQWKKGIELARGQYVWIAESDDYCEPSFLTTLIEGIDNNQLNNIVIAYTQSHLINQQNKILWTSKEAELECIKNGADFVKQKMIGGNSIFNASMAIFKRDFALQINDAYQAFKFCGDWLFWMQLAQHGDVLINSNPLNFFRKHDKDVSGAAYEQGLNYTEQLKLYNIALEQSWITKSLYINAVSKDYMSLLSNNNIAASTKKKIQQSYLNDESLKKLKTNFLKQVYFLKFKNSLFVKLIRKLK